MLDHEFLERMHHQMDRMSDKMDEVLSVVSDIRANEQVTEIRFAECEKKDVELEKKILDLQNNTVSKDQFKPIKNAYDWALRIVITAVVGALISMVIVRPSAIVKPEYVIEKPQTEQTPVPSK